MTTLLLTRGEPFTALFAFNDVSAIGAMQALRESGRRVPEDVSVVGFDDIQSAAYQHPGLTTVRQPLRRMGEAGGGNLASAHRRGEATCLPEARDGCSWNWSWTRFHCPLRHPDLMIDRSWTAFLLHASFVLTGVVTTLLGPILPILVTRWGLNDWQAGLLFTMQFAGSMMAVALSSVGMTRLGLRATLASGATLMASGVAALAGGPLALGYGAVLCYGIGRLGVTIPATNLAVAEQYAARRAAALNLLNLAWGVGAVTAPPLIAFLQRSNDTQAFLLGLAAALTLTAAALARSAPVPRQEATDSVPEL